MRGLLQQLSEGDTSHRLLAGMGCSVLNWGEAPRVHLHLPHTPVSAHSQLCPRLLKGAGSGWKNARGGYDGSFRGCYPPKASLFGS